jgi:hypothetical protein
VLLAAAVIALVPGSVGGGVRAAAVHLSFAPLALVPGSVVAHELAAPVWLSAVQIARVGPIGELDRPLSMLQHRDLPRPCGVEAGHTCTYEPLESLPRS